MDKHQILLSLVLQEAQIPASVEEFDNRLMVQKGIYLLQQRGVELGYPYNWYVRGPYSSRLADDLFCLVKIPDNEAEEVKSYGLGEKTRTLIASVKSLFQQDLALPDRARHLELLASVLFLIKTGQAKPDESHKLSSILKANGKPFETTHAEQAVALLKSHGYSV
jgi:uncharacterized protein YwgA